MDGFQQNKTENTLQFDVDLDSGTAAEILYYFLSCDVDRTERKIQQPN